MIQLEFFVDKETVCIRDELKKVKASNDRVRKSMFAKHGELAKSYIELSQRLDILERNICQGTIRTLSSTPKKSETTSLLDLIREA